MDSLVLEEIPLSDGPYKFKGLPGLIVKISDEIILM
jgi:GLPGLI family protein